MLIQSLIQYVDGIITICIELALGLFWHNLHFFNMHSMDKILSMPRQHKLIIYWIDVVVTFIKMDFQCHCISHKINKSRIFKQWHSLSQHWYDPMKCYNIKWANNKYWFNINQILHLIIVETISNIVLTLIHSKSIQHCIYIVPYIYIYIKWKKTPSLALESFQHGIEVPIWRTP
jgi:hypothetical protein